MSSPAVCCTPHTDAETIAATMADSKVRRMPVTDQDGRLVGIVAQADLATSGAPLGADRVGETVADVSEPTAEASQVDDATGTDDGRQTG
jgi:predicted transcriptional regulator